MLPLHFFDRYRTALLALPVLQPDEHYSRNQLISDAFRIFRANGLDVFYAPFHYSNPRAKLVGLTPGFTQMANAFRAAKEAQRAGLSGTELFAHINRAASFSGPIRQNLVQMLDQIGLHTRLGIRTCSDLFAGAHAMVHFTSAVSAPIFKAEQNYNGSPGLLKVPQLREWVMNNLAFELRELSDAIIISLGAHAGSAIDLLVAEGAVDPRRCLRGFPHPSGANGHRKRLFKLQREGWGNQIASAAY